MFAFLRRKWWRIAAGIVAFLLMAVGAVAIVWIFWLNPKLTRYVESDAFRAELEKETAKGLHFPNGHYEPIHRLDTWTAESAGFQANDGVKALKSMEARGITAKFNPWGVFRRRWQLDHVHVQSGEVGIQTYEPKPESTPTKPWYAIFLPDRVYLNRVDSEPVDVTWQFRRKRAGFFGTRLLITPHDRDFEYQARGGDLKMAPFPELRLRHTHLLITKTVLELYKLDLNPKARGTKGHIHAKGKAGTRDDRSVDFTFELERLPIDDWLPGGWREHVAGAATGKILWRGENYKLENSRGETNLRVDGARIYRLPFLEKIAKITGEKELEQLELNVCSLELEWRYPKIDAKHLILEEIGKFRAEGEVIINKKALSGAIQLGVARRLLDWLPKAEEVFGRERDGYLWTTVHLSGTIDNPQQDLSPRIMEVIKESPGVALGLLFRQLGESLKQAFGSE
jgi:hypothetical protein